MTLAPSLIAAGAEQGKESVGRIGIIVVELGTVDTSQDTLVVVAHATTRCTLLKPQVPRLGKTSWTNHLWSRWQRKPQQCCVHAITRATLARGTVADMEMDRASPISTAVHPLTLSPLMWQEWLTKSVNLLKDAITRLVLMTSTAIPVQGTGFAEEILAPQRIQWHVASQRRYALRTIPFAQCMNDPTPCGDAKTTSPHATRLVAPGISHSLELGSSSSSWSF